MTGRKQTVAHLEQGLTLVELLVSLTLGLLVVVATTAGYLGLSEAARVADAQARMDEDGQAALAVLTANLRMAGNNPDRPYRLVSTRRNPVYPVQYAFAVRGCDRKFTNVTSAGLVQDLVCDSAAPSGPDSIAITYEADRFNTVTLPSAQTPTDCIGKPLNPLSATLDVVTFPGPVVAPQTFDYHVAENRFYIDSPGPGAPPSLYCKGNGSASTPSPLVENVEDLQLTYGTVPASAAETSSAGIAGYLDATNVVAHSALGSVPDEAGRWGKVASVRICLIVRSEKPIAGNEGSARYLKCDGTIESSPPDLHLRRAYSTTVVLRNRR